MPSKLQFTTTKGIYPNRFERTSTLLSLRLDLTGGLRAYPPLLVTALVSLRHTSYLGRLEHLPDIRRMSLEGEVIPKLALWCEAAGGLQYGLCSECLLTSI